MAQNDDALAATALALNEDAKASRRRKPKTEAAPLAPVDDGRREFELTESKDDRLRLLIERAERLIEEKKGIAEDIKDVFGEAKAVGYDPAIMREMIKRRAMNRDKLREREMLIETYSIQLGLEF